MICHVNAEHRSKPLNFSSVREANLNSIGGCKCSAGEYIKDTPQGSYWHRTYRREPGNSTMEIVPCLEVLDTTDSSPERFETGHALKHYLQQYPNPSVCHAVIPPYCAPTTNN